MKTAASFAKKKGKTEWNIFGAPWILSDPIRKNVSAVALKTLSSWTTVWTLGRFNFGRQTTTTNGCGVDDSRKLWQLCRNYHMPQYNYCPHYTVRFRASYFSHKSPRLNLYHHSNYLDVAVCWWFVVFPISVNHISKERGCIHIPHWWVRVESCPVISLGSSWELSSLRAVYSWELSSL